MIKEHYSILFCSLTGNTKKLADAIYETLPKDKMRLFWHKRFAGTAIRRMLYRILDGQRECR